jgi:hypothetical protein
MRRVFHKTKLPCIGAIQGSLVLVAQKYNRGEICFALTFQKYLPQSSGLENAVNCRTPCLEITNLFLRVRLQKQL